VVRRKYHAFVPASFNSRFSGQSFDKGWSIEQTDVARSTYHRLIRSNIFHAETAGKSPVSVETGLLFAGFLVALVLQFQPAKHFAFVTYLARKTDKEF
jgi:hypothetical protein